jgi:hypothetical protein
MQDVGWAKGSVPTKLVAVGTLRFAYPTEFYGFQAFQAKATLSSDLAPNRSDERATMRPPKAR